MKKTFLFLSLIFLLGGGYWYLRYYKNIFPPLSKCKDCTVIASSKKDPKNTSYSIDQKYVTLVNGFASVANSGELVVPIKTTYFGNEAQGDLNQDGVPDTALLLTQDGGGSGTFYYIVVALRAGDVYVGTNGLLLGDRIAPQTTEIKDGKIIVNYAERKEGEPMTTAPSVGVSKYFEVNNGILVSVQ
jgi:hypothetical protein